MSDLKTPVLLVTYKRLDTVQKVFERIRMVRPEKLYIASDGAKAGNAEEQKKISDVREWLDTAVDWPCEVYKRYSSYNQGCQMGVADAISWIFDNEERAIILEDDIVAEPDFFFYCQDMLEYYKNDTRVMTISGYKKADTYPIEGDYFFSFFSPIWGWATWKRAWKYFDVTMPKWPLYRQKGLLKCIYGTDAAESLTKSFNSVYEEKLDAWDYPWLFTRLCNSGLGIVPKVNLITNIGFHSADATHTFGARIVFNVGTLHFPLKIEENVVRNWGYDKAYEEIAFPKRKFSFRCFIVSHTPKPVLKPIRSIMKKIRGRQ